MAEALNQAVLAAVVSAVRRAVCLPDVQITPETRFSEDLSLDSLDLVELTIELEETFETELPNDAHARFWNSLSEVGLKAVRNHEDTIKVSNEVIDEWALKNVSTVSKLHEATHDVDDGCDSHAPAHQRHRRFLVEAEKARRAEEGELGPVAPHHPA